MIRTPQYKSTCSISKYHQKMMMQPELHQPSWPFYNIINSTLDQFGHYDPDMDAHVGDSQFSSSFTTTEDSSGISSTPYFPTVFSNDFVEFPISDEQQVALQVENSSLNMEGFEPILSSEIENIRRWLDLDEREESFPSQQLSIEGEDEWSPCLSMKASEASMDLSSIQLSLTSPEEMEIDNQLSILHLLEAYGEAMEKEQGELAEVILRCISEKVSPLGETVERLAFNLFQATEKQADYLRQESSKNFEAAFKAFYLMFPYGRIAHFTANSAILEAMPDDAEMIHIVDFDMGEGVQWPPMIEAIGRQQKTVKLTSIKWGEEDQGCATSQWRFEETRRRLYDHARSLGLKLKVEEMEIEDLVGEIKKMKKRGEGREWLAFNCMVGLPHMGSRRSRKNVMEFLRVAKDLMANSANCNTSNRGIITFGDGDAWEKLKICSGYGSFFGGYLAHYQALLESMEWNIPIHLAEARIAMESLFVAPYVSSLAWFQKWEEIREGRDLQAGIGLEGWKLSKENIMEAKEMVKEGESSYGVRIDGQNENEMVLEWRGTPLVRVSTWR